MNGMVSIFIEGIVRGEEESRITTNAIGEYQLYEGAHMIRYEEAAVERDEKDSNADMESLDVDEGSVNRIKISSGMVEMIKVGVNSNHMTFDLTKDTQSEYETPYGNLYFHVNTTKINLDERHNEIILNMEYTLSHNDSHISDNQIKMVVKKL